MLVIELNHCIIFILINQKVIMQNLINIMMERKKKNVKQHIIPIYLLLNIHKFNVNACLYKAKNKGTPLLETGDY